MANLGNPKNTIEIIQKYEFMFQKKFGQNFLIDTHVLEKIISAAGITKNDCVLEIGPGIGTMTQYLAENAGHVVAVEIVKCEEVPKSKKLLCSQVKIGSETRQILSGIKAWYKPEDMVGRKVMVVTNLKPAKLAGMLSEGMILCAEDDEGNLALMTPAKDIKSGSEVC